MAATVCVVRDCESAGIVVVHLAGLSVDDYLCEAHARIRQKAIDAVAEWEAVVYQGPGDGPIVDGSKK